MANLYVPQLINQAKQSKPDLPDWEYFLNSPEYLKQWGEALNVTPEMLLRKYRTFLLKKLPDPNYLVTDLQDILETELKNYWGTYSESATPPEMVQRLIQEIVSFYIDHYYYGKTIDEDVEYDFLSEFLRQLEMESTYAFGEEFLPKFVHEVRNMAEAECIEYLGYFKEDLAEAVAEAEGYAEEVAQDMMDTYFEEFSEAEDEIDEYGRMV